MHSVLHFIGSLSKKLNNRHSLMLFEETGFSSNYNLFNCYIVTLVEEIQFYLTIYNLEIINSCSLVQEITPS